MFIRLGDTIRICFGTVNGSGAATDADAPPTVTVLDQGSVMGYAPAVANKATGMYEVTIVASGANGFVEGHEYSAFIESTVASVTRRDGLASFAIRSTDASSVLTILGTPAAASVSEDIADVKSDTSLIPTVAPMIETLHRIGVGRWKIQGTQLLIYEDDETTVLMAFNLKDDNGAASNTRIFERMPVP